MNMRILIIAFFILLCDFPNTILGQSKKIDSLKNELKKTSLNDDEKYNLYQSLSSLYNENEPKNALPYIEKTLEFASKTKNKTNIGNAHLLKANYFGKTGNFEEALDELNIAEKFVTSTYEGQQLNFYIHISKGNILRRESKYEESLQSLLNANKIAEDTKNDTLLYASLTQLGILNVTMKNLDRALDYHKQAIDIAKKINDDRKISKSYGNIGIIYREKEEHEQGIEYSKKALEYAYKSGDSSSISYAMNELGTMYDRAKKINEATPYILEAIAIRERNHELDELAYSYIYLSGNLKRLGRINESEEAARKALSIAQSINNTKQVIDCYKMMYINFNESKKYDSAFIYLKKYTNIKDSLSGEAVKEKMEEMNIKYETQKKDLKIKDEKLKNTYLLAGIGILILVIGLLYSSGLRKKLKYKNQLQEVIINEQNKATKAIIEAEENERQRIANDLHDSVGQFMTAAKMNLQSLEDKIKFDNDIDKLVFEKAINFVNESAVEVRSISHNMAPNTLLKKGLANAVRNFLDNLNPTSLKVNLFTDGISIPLEKNTEIFLYRIIQECVNNTLKHANASELNISILINEKEIDVTLEDNGKGFDINNLNEKSGMGIENVQKRVHFLKGEIHWDSHPGNGTTVVINIPISNKII